MLLDSYVQERLQHVVAQRCNIDATMGGTHCDHDAGSGLDQHASIDRNAECRARAGMDENALHQRRCNQADLAGCRTNRLRFQQ